MKIQTNMYNKFISHTYLYFFLFLLALIFNSCNYKDSGFFSPVGESDDPTVTIPSLSELEGQFGVNYTYTENTCNDLTGEFNITAGIRLNPSNSNWIDIFFPDAPGAISGPYDGTTGNFMGETDRKPIGQGYTAQEMWDMDFYPRMSDDDNIVFGGISRVDVYNPDDTFNCGIDYNIYGEKTMLTVPQLIFPPNGSIDIDRDLTFEWQMLDLATGYDFQIIKEGESFENANSFSQSGLTSNMYPVEGLEFLTNYQWRVRAAFGNLKSDWSSAWSFSTKEEPATVYDLSVSKEGEGSVTSNPSGINCGDDCSEEYEEGTEVQLIAEAADGWKFEKWDEDVPASCKENNGNCNVTMDKDRSVKAIFVENKPKIVFPPPKICIEHGNEQSELFWLWAYEESLGYETEVTMRITLPNGNVDEFVFTSTAQAKYVLAVYTIYTYGFYKWEIIEAVDLETGEVLLTEGTTKGEITVDSDEVNAGQCEM